MWTRHACLQGWIEFGLDLPNQSPKNENKAFEKAMALAGSKFLDSVWSQAKSWVMTTSKVNCDGMSCSMTCIDRRGEIMVLTTFCPWKLHPFELKEELKIENSIKYVLYQDHRSKHWLVLVVAISQHNLGVQGSAHPMARFNGWGSLEFGISRYLVAWIDTTNP